MKILQILMLVILITLFSVSTVNACSCVQPGTATEELNKSTAVFSGVVEKIVRENVGRQSIVVVFKVSEVWKGDVREYQYVQTATSSASCGIDFEVGEEYLVFSGEEEGNLFASLCSATGKLSDSEQRLVELGPGNAPLPMPEFNDLKYYSNPFYLQKWFLGWVFVLIIVLLGVGLILLKKRRKH